MTISLETLGDGSVADRNFQALARLVLDTGGRSIGIRSGTQTLTWAGVLATSDFPTVTHGLGKTPVIVFTFPMSYVGGKFTASNPSSIGATTFVIQAITTDNTVPAAATTGTFGWVVMG